MGNLVHFYDKQYEGHLPRRCFPRRSSRFPSQQHRSRRGSRILLRESVHAKHVFASPTTILASTTNILASAHCPVRETPVRDTLKADSEEPSQGSEEKGAGEEEEAGTPQDESASSSTSNSESDCHLRHRNPVP